MHLTCHSEQEDALYDVLIEHLAQEFTDEDDETQKELQEKRFLEEFPVLKRKLEGHIRKLRDLADRIDQVHRDCTISSVVSSSTGIFSFFGLALAPFTGGASMLLSGSAVGLGVAAAVTTVTTSALEQSNIESYEDKVNQVAKHGRTTWYCNDHS